MISRILKITSILVLIFVLIVFYLSSFGIQTKKFNNKIKNEFLKINKKITLELKSVKLLLNPINLSINVETFGTKILINNDLLELESIKTNIPIRSVLNKKFSIDDLLISTKLIKLKDLVSLTRSFKNTPELFILENIIKDGALAGDIKLNFDSTGKLKQNYELKGYLKKAKLNVLNKYSIDNLNFIFNIKDKEYVFSEIKGNFNESKLSLPEVNIKRNNNKFLVDGKLITYKNEINRKLLNDLFKVGVKDIGIEDIEFVSNNEFAFKINKKLKISDFNFKSNINLSKLIYKKKSTNIKKYLPNFNETIEFNDHKISLDYKKNQLKINGNGKINIEGKNDKIKYEIKKKDKQYFFKTTIDVNQNSLLISFLNYKKKQNLSSILKLSGIYNENKKITFNEIYFKENRNKFLINNLKLNNTYKILDIDKIELDYKNKNKIINQIILKKENKKYIVTGEIFDLSMIIDEIMNSKDDEDTSSIFNNFNSTIDININKVHLDKTDFSKNFSGNINYKKNRINSANLTSNFPNKKKLILSIRTNENNEKITTFFTDYPKPLIKRFKFINGFEEGVLDLYSIEKNGVTNSKLTIENFKVKEVPLFAKLLSLASLQGIADLLTGEGIRFTNFDMQYSNQKGLMTIEELFSIGPAVSILMDGYVELDKLTSLRGTLVPATTINKSIAKIPLIGDILVGKKVGEGVFGISFKIKGPPKDLKTTVNPIKTLTPRFITRTIEKIKKN